MSQCLSCGCTEFDPCRLDDDLPCAWADGDHTLCTACVAPRYSLFDLLLGEEDIDRLEVAMDEPGNPRLYLPFGDGSRAS
jgi:hypothetical protein